MPTIQYREATTADTAAMARLRTGGGEQEEFVRDRMARYLAGTHHPQQALLPRTVYVAYDGETLVGYAAGHLTRRYDCDGEFQWIFVHTDRRGTGVAAELLRLVAAWFVEQKAPRVCVNVDPLNTPACRFYKRHGAGQLNDYFMVWEDIGVVLMPKS